MTRAMVDELNELLDLISLELERVEDALDRKATVSDEQLAIVRSHFAALERGASDALAIIDARKGGS